MNINNSLTSKETDNRVARESVKERNLALCPGGNSSPGNIMSLRANQSNQRVKKIESRYINRETQLLNIGLKRQETEIKCQKKYSGHKEQSVG
jgi:hypothetical protein